MTLMRSVEQRFAHREYMRAWRAANPDRARATDRAWHAKNPGYRKQRRAANIEVERERTRAWRRANPDRDRASSRAWGTRNIERKRAIYRAWARANPEKRALVAAARRARRAGAAGSHTVREWLDKCALLGGVCLYCGEARPLTRDHKTPLSRGGTDYIENIVPACALCNSRKYNKTAQEFLMKKAA